MARHHLDAEFIRSLKPSDKDQAFFDDIELGLGIRLKPSGVATFFLQYRSPPGTGGRTKGQRRIGIGRAQTATQSGLTAKEARKKAKALRTQINDGKDPQDEKAELKNKLRVSELCDQYLEVSRNRLKASTLAMDKSRIESHVKPLLGSRFVADLKPRDIETFRDEVAEGKSAKLKRPESKGPKRRPVTGGKGGAGRVVGMLATILQRAVRDGTLATNPARGIGKLKHKPKKPAFSFGIVKALGTALREMEAEGAPKIPLQATRLLLLTGCRRMEVLTLRWGMVDFESRCLRLADTKTGPQVRPIGSAALELLASIKPENARASDFVFPGSRKGAHYASTQNIWNKIRERLSADDATIYGVHSLRHFYASAASALNFSELTIGALLGHSFGSVTSRYAHAPDSVFIQAANVVSQRLADELGVTV